MHKILNLVFILSPLFIGFILPSNKKIQYIADVSLQYLVMVILTYIGIELSYIQGLSTQISMIIIQVLLLSLLSISSGLIGLMIFDKLHPLKRVKNTSEHQNISIKDTILQVSCIFFGFLLGMILPKDTLPDSTMTLLLILLILMVGISLKGSGISLKEVFVNKRGMQTSIIFTISVLLSGIVYSFLVSNVSITQGMAMVSGFGWYSLSAVVMAEAYGPIWGSIALFNDLLREICALILIPTIMKSFPSSAIGLGGATSLDFTLPIIQQSGGNQVVPIAISFGFIINLISPLLMIVISSF